ncbi:MAG TPA: zinc metalloprotease HtpX, partial [Gammaproteobacteria bacterium]|nr:zinc metalloprotease HtpX [Gammaproteobacteria bacterium]
ELTPRQAPGVFRVLDTLARRAALPALPKLYYIPSSVINAFAVGTRRSAGIAVSDGMFQALSERELCGVLAHEISHIRHNDTWVMGLADLFSRLTAFFSMFGQLILLLYVPVAVFSKLQINWLAVLALVFAPTVSVLLQLALSRTREYEADLGAAELSGDPEGFASALRKIERHQGRFLEQIFFPGRRIPDPSLLRTHPATDERIRRLRQLQPEPALQARLPDLSAIPHTPRARTRRPRWHFPGTWY